MKVCCILNDKSGSANVVASALLGYPSTHLGVLPLGALNHFARDLGIPFDVSGAIDIVCAGHSIGIDDGAVNDSYS